MPSTRLRHRRSNGVSSVAALLTRVERVEALSHDLARELRRGHDQTAPVRAMADAIEQDAAAVCRALKQ